MYSILIWFVQIGLKGVALFNPKIRLFVNGRNEIFSKIASVISKNDKVIWMHAASLGEFEQGRPIIESIKENHPSKKIVVTFFSPSGYEIRKNYEVADVVCYLPLDSKRNMKRFVDLIKPELIIIVKYEFWPNLLFQLKKQQIRTVLISGIFREKQVFFKWYGSWFRKSLMAFDHFFVQDKDSKKLLNSINFNNVSISGDTRFDRVYEITKQNNKLNFVKEFVNNTYTVVAGSTWEEDEKILVNYINNSAAKDEKFIIAPHNINEQRIQELKRTIKKRTVLFSEKEEKNLEEYQVFIIDTIGILTKIYSYASIAYVGGGYTKSGIHNILEPATFGVPIVIGPNYSKFKEAIDLVKNGACFSIESIEKLSVFLEKFYNDNKEREIAGDKAKNYVVSNLGATSKILNYLNNERKTK
jgi:3-deoxy-D-manno-octulosonic-acid transferase